MTPTVARWQRVIAMSGDVLSGCFVALALWSHLLGGFRIGSGVFAISTRSAERLLIQAALICLIRHLIVRQPSLRSRIVRLLNAQPSALVGVPARELGIALAAFVPLTVWFLWPQVMTPGGVPDHGDPLFSMWMLSHIADRLANAPSQFYDGRIFFPEADTFLWSDLTLLPGLISAPFLWAGVPVAAMYTTLIILGCLLSCVTMFVLVRATTGMLAPALVAGALFGFFPYRFAHYSHLQMQGVFLMPLAAWLLLRALERPGVARGLQLGTTVALQVLWSTYCGAFLIVGLAAATLGSWLSGRDVHRRHITTAAAAVGVCIVLMSPYLTGYYRARDVVGERPRGEVLHYGAGLADYLSPNGNWRWYREHAPIHTKSEEHHLAPGVGMVVLAAIGVAAAPTTMTVIVGVGLVAAVNASLGLSSFTYSLFFDYVPLLKTFRVPARFGLVAGVFLVWAAGLGIARLWRVTTNRNALRVCVGVACAIAILEVMPRLELRTTETQLPAIYGSLPSDRRVVLLELPVPGKGAEAYWVDPTYLYRQTFHQHALINGYSGFYPPWYGQLSWASSALPDDKAWAAVLKRGPEFIIVHEEHYGLERYRAVVDDLDHRPELTTVATARTPAGESRLYQLRPATPVSAPAAASPVSAPAPAPHPPR
jgi:hypothetical protein